jgi:hypothetical protein
MIRAEIYTWHDQLVASADHENQDLAMRWIDQVTRGEGGYVYYLQDLEPLDAA